MTTTLLPPRTARNASVQDIASILQQQDRQTVDLVFPASSIVSSQGELLVGGVEAILGPNGVLDPNGSYTPTPNAVAQLGGIFDIPVRYTRRMRDENVQLFDASVNSWANHASYAEKNVLVRLLAGVDPARPGSAGILRAILSDCYGARDNLATLLSVLDGIREAGLSADDLKISGDLTDDKMYITVNAPEIRGYGWQLLDGYRSPYGNGAGTGHGGLDAENLPIISAGLVIRNSETGRGALSITPRLVVRACNNGLTVTKDAMRQIHLGARLNEGAITWSDETRRASNDLSRSQAKDAVASFLNQTYVEKVIAELEEDAGTPVQDVTKTIEVVSKEQGYSEDESKSILNFFIDGGQRTAGGVLHAVTAAVQQIEDPDRAYEIEAGAIGAMKVAVRENALV